MAFLFNAWYAAGWSEELTDKPLGRTLLGLRVVLYRDSEGAPVAIGDTCPHRFAPLHKGKVKGDVIECPYHGLQFNGKGACAHNPHGDGKIPTAAQVPSYMLVEKQGVLWIWMGNVAKADPSKIIDIEELTYAHGPFSNARGYLHVDGNYQLAVDNLLDLSHVQFLHPLLGAGVDFEGEFPDQIFEMKQEGETVWAYQHINNFPTSPFYTLQWGEGSAPKRGDMRAHMRWDAPAILQLDTGATVRGGSVDQGPAAPSVHLLTPETETTSHYFWSVWHNYQAENPAITEMVKAGIGNAFQNEDEPMIAAVQSMMQTTDLMSLKPVLLPSDAAALRARRILQQKIDAETRL